MSWINFLVIALGGSFGAIFRYSITLFLNHYFFTKNFPVATLLSNFLGSFLLGIFFVLCLEKQILGENWKLFFIVGLAGSLTTFSTFSLETLQLLQKENYWFAFYNVVLNFGLTLCVLWLIFFFTKLFSH